MRRILHLVFFCSFLSVAFGQYPADMNDYTVSHNTKVSFYNFPTTHMEIPPWVIKGDWYTYIISNGTNSTTISVPESMTDGKTVNCVGKGIFPATGPNPNKPWKRNYSEIYSAHSFEHPTAGPIDIGFCHDENKNQCNMPNTINPAIAPNCSIQGNDYKAYYAMVSAIWTPCVQSNNWGQKGYNNDLGPIIWPSVGYVAPDNSTACEGFLQPSSIVAGDSLYIYAWDKGPATALVGGREGCTRGIKVIRVAIRDCLDPSRYEVYYKDAKGKEHWLPSLPAGFTKEKMLEYVRVAGPKSTDILTDEIPGNTEAFRFSVAQVKGQHYFIGCEEYVDNKDVTHGKAKHHVALRFSEDLVHWSARKKVIETSDSWDASSLNYPIFLNSDGSSNTEIDLNDFYVIGTHSQSPFPSSVTLFNIQYVPPQAVAPSLMSASSLAAPLDLTALGTDIRAYPNPNHGSFMLSYMLTTTAKTQINVFDTKGYRISSGTPTTRPPGTYSESVDLSSCGNGIYIIELFVDNTKKVLKVIRN